MAHYDNVEIIAENLGNFIELVRREKGLNIDEVVRHESELRKCISDCYSRALLAQGLPKEEHPTFSNVPRTMFVWTVRDNLESIFQAMDIPTTQKAANLLAQELRKNGITKGLNRTQRDKLEEMDIFQKEFTKMSNWMVKARNIILTMSENTHLLEAVTEEEKEFANLLDFDWYYDYSDDSNVWRNGNAKHGEVQAKVMDILVAKPHLKKVVEVVAKANGFSTKFFTG